MSDNFSQQDMDQVIQHLVDRQETQLSVADLERRLRQGCAEDPHRTVRNILEANGGLASSSQSSVPPSVASSDGLDTSCQTSAQLRSSVSTAIEVVLTYSYRTLDQDIARGRAVSTVAFAKKLAMHYAQERPLVVKNKATSVATVTSVSYNSGDCTEPDFVVTVQQTVNNTMLSAPRVDYSTYRVGMSVVDGRYLLRDMTGL
jgi:hypothetical protein